MKKETCQSMMFWFLIATTILWFVALVALMIAEVYIRWKLNQNFTFLGENGLPALVALFLGQLALLTFGYRNER